MLKLAGLIILGYSTIGTMFPVTLSTLRGSVNFIRELFLAPVKSYKPCPVSVWCYMNSF